MRTHRITWNDLKEIDPKDKIYTFDGAVDYIHGAFGLRTSGIPVVLACGVMDIIHQGHCQYVENASMYGLVAVGLENDESVSINKGPDRPVNSLQERMMTIASIGRVGLVFGFPDAPLYSDPGSFDAYIARYKKLNVPIAAPVDDPNWDLKCMQAIAADVPLMRIYGHVPNSTTQMLQRVGYEK